MLGKRVNRGGGSESRERLPHSSVERSTETKGDLEGVTVGGRGNGGSESVQGVRNTVRVPRRAEDQMKE